MSYSGDYDASSGYSGTYGGGAAAAPARQAERAAANVVQAARAPTVARPAAGRSDLLLNLLEFCLFIALIGVSAASVRQIKDITDNGSAADKAALCYRWAFQSYRLVIGILVVSSVGAVHTLFALILAAIKKLPASRYCLTFCILPHAITLITLGIIIIAWGSPSSTVAVGTSAWDFCRGVDPYQLAFSTGAVATAFGGFILLFGPGCALVAAFEDIKNNPRLVSAQQAITQEGNRFVAKNPAVAASAARVAGTSGASYGYSDYSDDAGDDEGYSGGYDA
jgi:hypothetical protein